MQDCSTEYSMCSMYSAFCGIKNALETSKIYWKDDSLSYMEKNLSKFFISFQRIEE